MLLSESLITLVSVIMVSRFFFGGLTPLYSPATGLYLVLLEVLVTASIPNVSNNSSIALSVL